MDSKLNLAPRNVDTFLHSMQCSTPSYKALHKGHTKVHLPLTLQVNVPSIVSTLFKIIVTYLQHSTFQFNIYSPTMPPATVHHSPSHTQLFISSLWTSNSPNSPPVSVLSQSIGSYRLYPARATWRWI